MPELVFGHLLTGSNFAEDSTAMGAAAESSGERAATGGRHGYGAKLTNIFSTEFTVETYDSTRGLLYRQTWKRNMHERQEPLVTSVKQVGAGDYTRVTFKPDVARFGMKHGIDAGTASLMRRRALDAAGTVGADVTVTLDNSPVHVAGFEAYAQLYAPVPAAKMAHKQGHRQSSSTSRGKQAADAVADAAVSAGQDELQIALPAAAAAQQLSQLQYLAFNRKLEIVVGTAGLRMEPDVPPASAASASATASSSGEWSAEELDGYNQPASVSFVNCMHTPRGGSHVTLVVDALAKQLADYIQKRMKRPAGGPVSTGSGTPPLVLSDVSPLCSGLQPAAVTPAMIKQHLRVLVNAKLENPSFDSQSKEQLVSSPAAVAASLLSKAQPAKAAAAASAPAAIVEFELPERYIRAVAEQGGVLHAVLMTLQAKAGADLARTMKRASRGSEAKIKGIPKLEDANLAGSKRAADCTLILTEGDSAKALAVSGLAVVGRDKYGVFPLRGKLLNVRDMSVRAALENTEVAAIIQILGLDFKRTYEGEDAAQRGLRYGRVMIMADQDVDGSHIKGLLVNMLHTYWPKLLESAVPGGPAFVEQFITPVIKARQGSKLREFFSVKEFDAWRRAGATGESSHGAWHIKYYKGLGTSTSAEGRQYFSQLDKHRKQFVWSGIDDGQLIHMAFAKDRTDDRKAWLAKSHDAGETSATAAAPATADAADKDSAAVSFADFINRELIEFSRADLVRSIPSVIDGLKPSQRKVLYACFKRAGGRGSGVAASLKEPSLASLDADAVEPGEPAAAAPGADRKESQRASKDDKGKVGSKTADASSAAAIRGLNASTGSEIKVAQLAGYVAEHTAYHHGEASLVSTIVGMAQDFVGANNLPLLQPVGQFGTRLQGGKDAASARYIFTKLSPVARALFPAADDELLRRRDDDGDLVEPHAYVPIIPLVLVNGATGIGTGWSTYVPMYHPLAVVDAVEAALQSGWATAPPDSSKLDLQQPFELQPWWRGFKGGISKKADGFTTMGQIAWDAGHPRHEPATNAGKAAAVRGSGKGSAAGQAAVAGSKGTPDMRSGRDYLDGLELTEGALQTGPGGSTAVRISELPVGKWTEDYKAFLQQLMANGLVKSFREYHSEVMVEFVVSLTPQGLRDLRQAAGDDASGSPLQHPTWWSPQHLSSFFKLSSAISTRNMHLFDAAGGIKRYTTPWHVVADFVPVRHALYSARKSRTELVLQRAASRMAAKQRFLQDVVSNRLVVGNKSRAELVRLLQAAGYPTDALSDDEASTNTALAAKAAASFAQSAGLQAAAHLLRLDLLQQPTAQPATSSDARSAGYAYLLNMPIWQLTSEALQRTSAVCADLQKAIEAARTRTSQQLWQSDLDVLRQVVRADPVTAEAYAGTAPAAAAAAASASTRRQSRRKQAVE